MFPVFVIVWLIELIGVLVMLLVDCAEGVTLGEINADSDLLIVGDRFGLTVCKGDTVFFDEEVRLFEFIFDSVLPKLLVILADAERILLAVMDGRVEALIVCVG